MRIELPVKYSQFDDAWARTLLGTNTDPKYTIYNYGCFLSCLAMICRYYGIDENPLSLNEKLSRKEEGTDQPIGFANGGLYKHGSLSKLYPALKEVFTPTPEPLTDTQLNDIRTSLDRKNPVVLKIDYNPMTLPVDDHFVIAVDYDPNDENNFTIVDPLGGMVRSLKDYLKSYKPSARVSIEKYIVFTKVDEVVKTPESVSQPAPVITSQPLSVETPPVNQPVSALPVNYEKIVGNSSKWKELVAYLWPGENKNEDEVSFEDSRRVIGGYKSAKTDYSNKMIEAEKKSAEANVLVETLRVDLRNLNESVTRERILHSAQLDALKKNTPSLDSLMKQYEGIHKEMEKKITDQATEITTLKVKIAKDAAEQKAREAIVNPTIETTEQTVAVRVPKKSVIELVKTFLQLRW